MELRNNDRETFLEIILIIKKLQLASQAVNKSSIWFFNLTRFFNKLGSNLTRLNLYYNLTR